MLTSVEQTLSLGGVIAALARPGELIALDGELGAGKTQFVRGMARVLLEDGGAVASPTFVMVHEHGPIAVGAAKGGVLVHVDAYRVTGAGDLETLGWTAPGGGELAHGAIVVVEWASRIEPALGPDLLRVALEHAGDRRRIVTITARGTWSDRIEAARVGLAFLGASFHGADQGV
jgi:tRNA threonylcarbamoyladenosine biosynthesis protein TsaE